MLGKRYVRESYLLYLHRSKEGYGDLGGLFNITYGKCYTIHLVLLLYLNARDLISEEPSVLVYFCDCELYIVL